MNRARLRGDEDLRIRGVDRNTARLPAERRNGAALPVASLAKTVTALPPSLVMKISACATSDHAPRAAAKAIVASTGPVPVVDADVRIMRFSLKFGSGGFRHRTPDGAPQRPDSVRTQAFD